MGSLLRAISIRLGIGALLALIAVLVGVVSHAWSVVQNVLGTIGLGSFIFLWFAVGGGGGVWRSRSVTQGFHNVTQYKENQATALSFGITMVLLGIPCLVCAVLLYFTVGYGG